MKANRAEKTQGDCGEKRGTVCVMSTSRQQMKTRKFDRLILSVIGTAVVVLAAASLVHPTNRVTASPRVYFDLAGAETGHLTPEDPAMGGNDAEELPAPMVASDESSDSQSLAASFQEMGYHLDRVREEGALVPRVFLARLPDDLHLVPEISLKKTVFFQTTLPLVLKENERILADRYRLHKLKADIAMGRKLAATDRLWLTVLAERYKGKDENLDVLLQRVDVIPPSLAMAQAAEESGWGTSRFAQAGNALFGQWTTTSDKGLIPEDREEDASHKIKSFATLSQSVSAYMRNLNTHRAYRELRQERAHLRRAGEPLDGRALAGTLTRYSERGSKYIGNIQSIIDANGLRALDDARLIDVQPSDQSA